MNFLEKVRLITEKRIQKEKQEITEEQLLKMTSHRQPLDFFKILKESPKPRIIAEIKRSSPSLGAIAPGLNPVEVAGEYLESGAAALSVLTEPHYFSGSVEVLKSVRQAYPKTAILMKDFIIDEYQLLQARAFGADAVLLIPSLISLAQVSRFHLIASAMNLSVLAEVHTGLELEQMKKMGIQFMGVNNRNLSTLEVSLAVSKDLIKLSGANDFLISESGIENRQQIQELTQLGYESFLVGSSLMKTLRPGEALRDLRSAL